jgi:hypothetical protein
MNRHVHRTQHNKGILMPMMKQNTLSELIAEWRKSEEDLRAYDAMKPAYEFHETALRVADEAMVDRFNSRRDRAVNAIARYRCESLAELLEKLEVFFEEEDRDDRGDYGAGLDPVKRLRKSCAYDLKRLRAPRLAIRKAA